MSENRDDNHLTAEPSCRPPIFRQTQPTRPFQPSQAQALGFKQAKTDSLTEATQIGPKLGISRKGLLLNLLTLPAEGMVPLTGFEPVTPSLRKPLTAQMKSLFSMILASGGWFALFDPNMTQTQPRPDPSAVLAKVR